MLLDLLPTLEKETVRSHSTCTLHYYSHCLVIRANCSYCPAAICIAVIYGSADRTPWPMLDDESGGKSTETTTLLPKQSVASRLVTHLAEVNKFIILTQ